MGYSYNRQANTTKEAVSYNSVLHRPAEADEAIAKAYQALVSFKQGLDAMEEIPDYLRPQYDRVMKAMNSVGDARRDTTQLREMVRKFGGRR